MAVILQWLCLIWMSLLITIPVPVFAGSATLYNTSLACLRGKSHDDTVSINCYDKDHSSVVVVHRIFHGLTPLSNGCSVSAPNSTCCPQPWQPDRDCVFANDGQLGNVRNYCDVSPSCNKQLNKVAVGNACPPRNTTGGRQLTYNTYSDFAFVEFSCVNIDLIVNVGKGNGTATTGEELFVGTNYPWKTNGNIFNTTRSCLVTTYCGHTLTFEVVDLGLTADPATGTCTEIAILTESNGGTGRGRVLAEFNCTSGHLAELFRSRQDGGAFVSQASVVGLDLRLHGNNTGRMLLRVTATDDAPVTVTCGLESSETFLNNTVCLSQSTPTPPVIDRISPSFNTSQVCFMGRNQLGMSVVLDCQQVPGVISVDRIIHGVVPNSAGCNNSVPNICCPQHYDPQQVCIFSSTEGLSTIRKKSDGKVYYDAGLTSSMRATVGDRCPPRQTSQGTTNLTYGNYSHFAIVEYSCINTGVLSDVCHDGSLIRKSEVYLDSNVYHLNKDQANASCHCVVTTDCGRRILFHALDLDLDTVSMNGTLQCMEEVQIEDKGNDSVVASLDCNDNEVDEKNRQEEVDTVFESESNMADFHLIFRGNHTGKLLFKVTATGGAVVEIRCGQTTKLDVWEQHRCPTSPPLPTITVTTTTMAETTTTVNLTVNTNIDQSGNTIETGVAVGVGVLAFLLVVIIIVLIIIIWRNKKPQPDPTDEFTVHYVSAQNDFGEEVDALPTPYLPRTNTYDTPSYAEKHPYSGLDTDYMVVVRPLSETSGGEKSSLDADGYDLPYDLKGVASGEGDYQRHISSSDTAEESGAVGGMAAVNPTYDQAVADLDNQFNNERARCGQENPTTEL